MNDKMTIKDIAGLCGVGETTVRRWIDIASGKTPGEPAKTADDRAIMAHLSAKTAEAQESKDPARFDLTEVVSIVRAGGNETLANLLAENAERKKREEMKLFLGVIGGDSGEPLNLEHCIILQRELHKNMGRREANACFKKAIGYEPPKRFPSALPRKNAGLIGDGKGGQS